MCTQQLCSPTGNSSGAAGSQEKFPRALRACRAPRAPPAPLCPWRAQPASPVGSQLPRLQHRDHSAPLRARLLLQPDHDDVPSSPGTEMREMSHPLHGGCCQLRMIRAGYPSSAPCPLQAQGGGTVMPRRHPESSAVGDPVTSKISFPEVPISSTGGSRTCQGCVQARSLPAALCFLSSWGNTAWNLTTPFSFC